MPKKPEQRRNKKMPTLTLTIGNIGSGKSLISSKLAKKGSVVFNMDSFQAMISGGVYGAYDPSKKEIYLTGENATIEQTLARNFNVVVDRTNMKIKDRQRFIEIGRKYGAKIIAYNFGQGTDQNLINRKKDCRGVPVSVWKEIFQFMQKSYEAPTNSEGFDSIIEMPKKYTFHAFDFDGTLVQNKFPEIGDIITGTANAINSLFENLSNIIIIWTCRSGEHELAVRKFLNDNNIFYDFINENPMFETQSRKVFAHKYYDDRNVFI
jgi:predicted kinase